LQDEYVRATFAASVRRASSRTIPPNVSLAQDHRRYKELLPQVAFACRRGEDFDADELSPWSRSFDGAGKHAAGSRRFAQVKTWFDRRNK